MAREMKDISLDEGDDLLIDSGDLLMVESTAAHQRQLLLNNKGDFKENPTICAGVFNYLNDENFEGMIRAINVEFCRDGMTVSDIKLNRDGSIETNAVYQ
jgi:hypothetical protein